ncbi:MAG TPA: hypothetical protein VM597_39300, partial [Gemmataceae bacterium]|nr:hypothetical protein [Gemmataceae bacterium]
SVTLVGASHQVAVVAGQATAGGFAFKSGKSPGLTVGTVAGVVGVQAPAGTITIRSVNDLTVTSALIDAGDSIALVFADGNAAGKLATVHGAFLDAPNGATITGGVGSDTFNLKASATTKIEVDGGLPSSPVSPGDTLAIDAEALAVTVKYQGMDGTVRSVEVTGRQPVRVGQIETLSISNDLSVETKVEGNPVDDLLILEKFNGKVVFSLNGGAKQEVHGDEFTFDGLAGNDEMRVSFAGGDLKLAGGVTFNGGIDNDLMKLNFAGGGATTLTGDVKFNGMGGDDRMLVQSASVSKAIGGAITFDGGTEADTLQVQVTGHDGKYRPTGANSGKVTAGTQEITFAQAEGVDAFDANTFSVVFPGANDTLTVENGTSFGPGAIPALKVSNAGVFAPIALWSNETVVINTADTAPVDGNDSITIASADNAHGNTNLEVRTGVGTDLVTINNPVAVDGSFTVQSVKLNVNANAHITAGKTVTLTHTGELKLDKATVSGKVGVTEDGGGAVTLTGDATVESTGPNGAVSFKGAVDGVESLTVTATKSVTFLASVGKTTPLEFLDVTGAAISLDGSKYQTQDDQTYTGPVTVSAGDVTFTSLQKGITFNGKLAGAADGVSAVTLSAPHLTDGAISFNGKVGELNALAKLTATAKSIAVNGELVETTGDQTYTGAVTVGVTAKFVSTGAGNITFDGTLNSVSTVGVEVNTAGTTFFQGAVEVGSLKTDFAGAGTTKIQGGAATIKSTGTGGLTFGDPVEAAISVGFEAAGTAPVTFSKTLTAPNDKAVRVTAIGDTTFGGVVNVGTLLVDGGGSTAVNGGLVTTKLDQTFHDKVTVGKTTNFTSTDGGAVQFSSRLDSAPATAFTVRVTTEGETRFFGRVGDLNPLLSLITDVKGLTRVKGDLNDGLIQTTDSQLFQDRVRLDSDVEFVSISAGVITFGDTLDGPGGATIRTDGVTTFAKAVGVGEELAFLTTVVGGTTQVNGGVVRTKGHQTYGDVVLLGANTKFNTTSIDDGVTIPVGRVAFDNILFGENRVVEVNSAGAGRFAGQVRVGMLTTDAKGSTTLSTKSVVTEGAQTFNDRVFLQAKDNAVSVLASDGGGNVTFGSRVDGPGGLTVATAGVTEFRGPVGGEIALASLTTGEVGTTVIGGGLVRTVGAQGYGDAVHLTAGVTFTSGINVTFGQTLTGLFSVETSSPQVVFNNSVTVGKLTVHAAPGPFAGVTVAGPSISATAGQAYALPVAVTGDTQFTSDPGNISFLKSLAGNFRVTLVSPGSATLGGPVRLVNLATDAGGTTVVRGGSITTDQQQQFNDAVVVADRDAGFTSLGGGNIVFGKGLFGGVKAVVSTAGITRFDHAVDLGELTTDSFGVSAVNAGVVRTAGSQTFGDTVTVSVPAVFRAGANALFGGSLLGGTSVVVESPQTTYFGGPVSLASLVTDAGGQTGINGGSVATAGGQFFGDAVGVGADTTFTSTGGAGVVFGSTLSGAGRAVAVNTTGQTVFTGAVRVGALVTNAGGATAVNGGSVVTDGRQLFNDDVTVGADTTFTAGDNVQFSRTLIGKFQGTVQSPGTTSFGGQVDLKALTTDAAGVTAVATDLVRTSGTMKFEDGVVADVATTFSGGDIAFKSVLTGGVSVSLISFDVTFFAPVTLGSLTTDADGKTTINGGSVVTTGVQSYGDDVLLGASANLTSTAGDLSFFGRVDVVENGAQGLTAVARAGTVHFGSAVGFAGKAEDESDARKVASLTADARLTRFTSDVAVFANVDLNSQGGGVEQTGGFLTAKTLTLTGSGTTFSLGQLGTDKGGNDITDTFRANVTGPVTLADFNDLTVDGAGIITRGHALEIQTGTDLTAKAPGTSPARYDRPLIDVGGAEIRLSHGAFSEKAKVVLDAEIKAARAVFGVSGLNTRSDTFDIRPSAITPIEVNGNAPVPLDTKTLGTIGDRLSPILAGAGTTVTGFIYNGQDGHYTFTGREKLSFTGIEGLEDLSLAGFVVQTSEPRDSNNSSQIGYSVRIIQSQQGQQLPGGLDGESLPQNPFVVAPAFVNPVAPNSAPRLAFGDVDGDRVVDVILANGPGTAPQVTVINGLAVLNLPVGASLPRLEDLPNLQVPDGKGKGGLKDAILAQFFAYDPRFFGGVNVAAADLNGDGKAEVITGPDVGGGPHVKVFNGASLGPHASPTELDGFFAYESTFTGGV